MTHYSQFEGGKSPQTGRAAGARGAVTHSNALESIKTVKFSDLMRCKCAESWKSGESASASE